MERYSGKAYTVDELVKAYQQRGRIVDKRMLEIYISKGHIKAEQRDGKYFVMHEDVDWEISAEPIFYDWEETSPPLTEEKFCSICERELLDMRVRYDERGYAFCSRCYPYKG